MFYLTEDDTLTKGVRLGGATKRDLYIVVHLAFPTLAVCHRHFVLVTFFLTSSISARLSTKEWNCFEWAELLEGPKFKVLFCVAYKTLCVLCRLTFFDFCK